MTEQRDYISQYTRKEAIEDGILIDVSEAAKEAGFKVSVAVTNTLWASYIEPSEIIKSKGQSMDSRLWDVLFWLYIQIQSKSLEEYMYWVSFIVEHHIYAPNGTTVLQTKGIQEKVLLIAVMLPGDDYEPVITISLSHED